METAGAAPTAEASGRHAPSVSGPAAVARPLQTLLRMFGDARVGEGRVVLAMLANLCSLLAGYYVLETVREHLVLSSGGAEMKSCAAAAQAAGFARVDLVVVALEKIGFAVLVVRALRRMCAACP